MTTVDYGLGTCPAVCYVRGELWLAFTRYEGNAPTGIALYKDGVESFIPNANSPGVVTIDEDGYLAYRTPDDAGVVVRPDGSQWSLPVLQGTYCIKLGYGAVVYSTASGIYSQPRDGSGSPIRIGDYTSSMGLAYLTSATTYVTWDDNRLSHYPPAICPAFAGDCLVGQRNKPEKGIAAQWGAIIGYTWAGEQWNDVATALAPDGTVTFAAWQPGVMVRLVTGLTQADITAWGGTTPPEPPYPPTPPSPDTFTSFPSYGYPSFCSPFYSYRMLDGHPYATTDPIGNCQTFVGDERDPAVLGRELDEIASQLPTALVVLGFQEGDYAERQLNKTVAWWAAGSDIAQLGERVRRCQQRPSKPVIAYLDRRGWPSDRPDWLTDDVWPSVQAYINPGESLADFEAAVRRDLETVQRYDRKVWLTVRLDLWVGAAGPQLSVETVRAAAEVCDRLAREYELLVVGWHLFADKRAGGMAEHPALRAIGHAFAGACGPRPSRYDYQTPRGMTVDETLGYKVSQRRGTYQLSVAECERVTALLGGAPPEPPPHGDLPDPPNGFWAVEAEWAAQPPDGTPDSNLAFCRRVAQRLVAAGDPRWGLNWKRGVVDDPSVDIVSYRWGPTDADARIVDIVYAAEDPTQHGPTWSVHTVEEAGAVLWYPA